MNDLDQANEARRRYAKEHNLDVMYAETSHKGFAAWTYSDGCRVPLRDFATLEGIQRWAERNRFAIIYVSY